MSVQDPAAPPPWSPWQESAEPAMSSTVTSDLLYHRHLHHIGHFPNHERRHSQRQSRDQDRERNTDNDENPQTMDANSDEKHTPRLETIQEKPLPEQPYHVFTTRKKWQLVYIVSLAGLFSPLSSNIYFPALSAIADAIHTKIALVSLTVTVYMAVQGIAPTFWGPLSDIRGRRITFIGTFSVYLMANVGLAFSKDFASLMVFRAIQAAGSAATVSVGAGVIGDITTAKERGGFMGSFGGIRMLGQSIGPVIGGVVTEYFGFHAIFWFLFILASLTLVLVVLFLPETLRSIAGNGTVPLRGINRPVISRSLRKHWHEKANSCDDTSEITSPASGLSLRSILSPLRFLLEKDVFAVLSFGAVVYTIWSMVTSSTTALFQQRFNLTNLQVGLIFLPNGAACVSGSYITGKLLDRDYAIVEAEYRVSHRIPSSVALDRKKLADFPVMRARLRSSWYLVIAFVFSVGGYGFSITSPLLESNRGMALPLFLQSVIAFTATAVYTQNSALMVDLYPGASASATAVNNLIRCSLGAIGVGVVQFIIDMIGAGFAFLIFAAFTAVLSPLLWLVWVHGETWRGRRIERLEREKMEKINAEGGESGRRQQQTGNS
ncbi:MFS general substrate transporter [Podospora didyma]|uniref:MFS general substrate transporter n=1 Tax=Podospora didyma TaxID=330526 RepID=A0AAE0P3K3_9PEZI|nr:MFS general substrate transporter [Podospora didyma]